MTLVCKYSISILFILYLSNIQILNAQYDKPNLYIDCDFCDINFLKKNIYNVNFVRDRANADIISRVYNISAGANGSKYTIDFEGLNEFVNMNDTVHFYTNVNSVGDYTAQTMSDKINLSLIRYLLKTPIADSLKPNPFKANITNENQKDSIIDPWHNWVFDVSLDAFLNGEQSSKYTNFGSSISAAKVLDDWKLYASLNLNYNESKFDYDDYKSLSLSRSRSANISLTNSLSDRFSLRTSLNWNQSTYNNLKNSFSATAGIEYSFLNLEEYVRKSLFLRYELSAKEDIYEEETIYFKNSERLFSHKLSLQNSFKQSWGRTYLSISYNNYLHDFSKNRIRLYGYLDVNIFEGFNVYTSFSYDSVHDLLSIPKGDATLEDVLLRRKLLETHYYYYTSIGISYSFGSIYSNIINPRFN